MRRAWFLSVVLLLPLLVAPAASAKEGDVSFGIGPVFYFDDGQITGRERRSILAEDEDFGVANVHYFGGVFWGAYEVLDNFRVGGSLRYMGPWTYTEDDDEDEEPEEFLLGQLLELSVVAEYSIKLVDDLYFMAGLEFGMAMLVPEGNLKAEIESLQGQGIDAWSTPRLGYLVGPNLGLRYAFNDVVALRFNVAFKWEQLFLFVIDDEVAGVEFEKDRQLDILRIHFGLQLEIVLP